MATEASLTVTGGNPDGTGSFTATCDGAVDNAGNEGEAVSVTYTVEDQTPPTTLPPTTVPPTTVPPTTTPPTSTPATTTTTTSTPPTTSPPTTSTTTTTTTTMPTTTTTTLPANPDAGDYFSDDNGHLFEDDINALAEAGITRGCNPPDNTHYCPDESFLRGQAAAFVRRALDVPASNDDYFTDDDESVFQDDINAIAEAGITFGCNPPDNTLFCPNEGFTRGQAAAFLRRSLDVPTTDSDYFSDDAGHVFEGDINAIAEAGITRGCNPPHNSDYCPDEPLTRGQAAAFVRRAVIPTQGNRRSN